MPIISPLASVRSALLSATAFNTFNAYAVQYLSPEVVADFTKEKYSGFGAGSFDTLFDYLSENSTATMVDSDGKMKWAPHNVLKDSNDFSSSTWNNKPYVVLTANATTAPDGTNTGWKMTNDATNAFLGQGFSWRPRYNDYKFTVFCKYLDNQWVRLMENDVTRAVWFDIQNGVVGTTGSNVTSSSIEDVGNGWYKCSFEVYDSFSLPQFFIIAADGDGSSSETDGNSIYIWGAHAHISSLGGMVDNPDEPVSYLKSYIPTGSTTPTSKPRRNHHAYNGYSWVNQGILIESKDQRTNLIYPSNDIDTSGDWGQNGTNRTANLYTGPDGELSLTRIRANTNSVSHHVGFTYTSTDDPMTASCFGRAISGSTINHFGIRFHEASNNYAVVYFSLEDGVVTKTHEGSAFDGTLHNYGVEDWGGGLFRFWVTVGGITGTQVRFIMAPDGDPTNDSGWNASGGFSAFAGADDDTTAIALGFFQLETAEASGDIPYPSSYLPTISGTVSRGEETLSVPFEKLGPYPKSTLTGSNLISGDPDDWTVTFGSNGMTAAGNGFDIVDNNDVLYAEQAITTVADTVYEISVKLVGDLSTNARIYAGTTTNLSQNVTGFQADAAVIKDSYDGILKGYFKAQGTTTYITVSTNDDSGGFRDFNVQEVTDVGIAFDFKGAFSATDNGRTRETVFLERNQVEAGEANDEHFQLFMSTAAADTGQLFAQKVIANVGNAQSITSAAYLATPQINLPISIAGINKVDLLRLGRYGGAQSSGTTSLMPSILYAKFNVAPIFDGTVSQVRYFRNAPDDFTATWLTDATKPSEEPSMSLTFEAVDDRSFVDTGWRVY